MVQYVAPILFIRWWSRCIFVSLSHLFVDCTAISRAMVIFIAIYTHYIINHLCSKIKLGDSHAPITVLAGYSLNCVMVYNIRLYDELFRSKVFIQNKARR